MSSCPLTQHLKYKRELVTILTRLNKEGKINKHSMISRILPLKIFLGFMARLKFTNQAIKLGQSWTTQALLDSRPHALADILAPLVGGTEHHVMNSKHLAEDLAEVFIEEGEIFSSHDVTKYGDRQIA